MLNEMNRDEWMTGWAIGCQIVSWWQPSQIHADVRYFQKATANCPWIAGYVAALASAVGAL